MDVALKEKARQLYMALGSDVSAPNSEPPTPTFIDATSLEVEEIKLIRVVSHAKVLWIMFE
jgi:hypothetical protein